jgi:protein-S-isoprenylcysteine O-methyltransferase Ste14
MARAFAWLGGAAFVAALAYTAYFYLSVLGRPADSNQSRLVAALLDAGLFGLFATHHSLMARSRAKRLLTRYIAPELERTIYVWTASALLVLTCALWKPIPGTIYRQQDAIRALHYFVQAGGFWLIFAGTRVINPLELSGIDQARGRIENATFKIVGPYRWVRHPIYLGWILMVFGTPDMTANRLAFAVISSAYLVIAIPWEERSLVEAFGDRYLQYRACVRWRVLPLVY